MRKSEMAKMVSKLTGMTFAKSLETIDCIFESISMSVAQGHRVHFRNFGSFYPRKKRNGSEETQRRGWTLPSRRGLSLVSRQVRF